MIDARHMQVGGWNLKLLDNTPQPIRDEFVDPSGDMRKWRTFVCFLASDVAHSEGRISQAEKEALDEQWLWVGPVWERGNKLREFGGPGLGGFMQNDRGSPMNSGTSGGAVTFPANITTIMQGWFPTYSNNGLRYGGAASATTTLVNELELGTYLPPLKPVLDELMAQTGNEYWIRPPGLIDWGTAANLFRSSPNVFIGEDMTSPAAGVRVLDVRTDGIMVRENVHGYTNAAKAISSDYVWGTGGSALADNGGGSGGPDLRDWYDANGVQFAPAVIRADTNDFNDVNRISDTVAEYNARAERTITVTAMDTTPILSTGGSGPVGINPGDWVHVYSPADGIVDVNEQVVIAGQTLHPDSVRTVAVQQPFLKGMGVYTCRYAGSSQWQLTRITDYVDLAAEPQATTIELGTPERPPVPARYASYLT